jgi:hypothetical protein
MTTHPLYIGAYNSAGKKHGISVTAEGTEHWVNGLLHKDDGPAQITNMIDGSFRVSHYRFGLLHATGHAARRYQGADGKLWMYENYQYGMRHGESVQIVGPGSHAVTHYAFGVKHGWEVRKQGHHCMARLWDYGTPSGQWVTLPEPVELPALQEAARAIVELSREPSREPSAEPSENSSEASTELAPTEPATPEPVITPPRPSKKRDATCRMPRSRVVRFKGAAKGKDKPIEIMPRSGRQRTVPARYRSSHY